MAITFNPFLLLNSQHYSQQLLTTEWMEKLDQAVNIINQFELVELTEARKKLHTSYQIPTRSETDELSFREVVGRNALVALSYKWRKQSRGLLTDRENVDNWSERLPAEKKGILKEIMANFQRENPFHLYRSDDLLLIIDNFLPFFKNSVILGKQNFKRHSKHMPKAFRQRYSRWLGQFNAQVDNLEQALTAALVRRLEVSFVIGDVSYDDTIAYTAMQLRDLNLITTPTNLQTGEKGRLLPVYQRRGWTQANYLQTIRCITEKAPPSVRARLDRLPLFIENVNPFPTVNRIIDGVKLPVPRELESYIPSFTFLLPKALFRGTYARLELFANEIFLTAQLKIPLPDLQAIRLDGDDLRNIAYHPTLQTLEKRRHLLQERIRSLENQVQRLSWYQGKTKKCLNVYRSMLNQHLEECNKREVIFIKKVRYAAYPYKKHLTVDAVLDLHQAIHIFNQAYSVHFHLQTNKGYVDSLLQTKKTFISLQKKTAEAMNLISNPQAGKEIDWISHLHLEHDIEIEIAKHAHELQLYLQDKLDETTKVFLRALSEGRKISLEQAFSNLSLFACREKIFIESVDMQEIMHALIRAIERSLRMRNTSQTYLHNLTGICEYPPLNQLIPETYQQVLISFHEMNCEQKILFISKFLDMLKLYQENGEQHAETISQWLKITRMNVSNHSLILLKQAWIQIKALLTDDVYACVFSNIDRSVLTLDYADPTYFEQMKSFVIALYATLEKQIKKHNQAIRPCAELYRILAPIVGSLTQDNGTIELINSLQKTELPTITPTPSMYFPAIEEFHIEPVPPIVLDIKPFEDLPLSREGEKDNEVFLQATAKLLFDHLEILEKLSLGDFDTQALQRLEDCICLGKIVRLSGDMLMQQRLNRYLDHLLKNFTYHWQLKNNHSLPIFTTYQQFFTELYHRKTILNILQEKFFSANQPGEDDDHLLTITKEMDLKIVERRLQELMTCICSASIHYMDRLHESSNENEINSLPILITKMAKEGKAKEIRVGLKPNEKKLFAHPQDNTASRYAWPLWKRDVRTVGSENGKIKKDIIEKLVVLQRAKNVLIEYHTELTLDEIRKIEDECQPIFASVNQGRGNMSMHC